MIPPGPPRNLGKPLGESHQKSLVGVPKIWRNESGAPRATSVEEDVEWFVSQTPEGSDRMTQRVRGEIISSVENRCSAFFSYFENMSSVSIPIFYGKSPGGVVVWSEEQPHRLGIGVLSFYLLELFGEG